MTRDKKVVFIALALASVATQYFHLTPDDGLAVAALILLASIILDEWRGVPNDQDESDE